MAALARNSNSNNFRPGSNNLRDAALAPATILTYTSNFNGFLSFAKLSPAQFRLEPVAELDQQLALYIEHLYTIGRPFDSASHALNAVVFNRPAMRSSIGESRLRLRGWQRGRTCESHPPLTWELTVLIAVTMSRSGFHSSAIGMLLSFDCYLRVGELQRLTRGDIVMPNDPRMGSAYTAMALRLGRTKTGLNQFVTVERRVVAELLRFWIDSTSVGSQPSDSAFPFTAAHFRNLMRSTVHALGLGHIPYVPHSLRHGGATAANLRGATIEQIMQRGRWAVMKSASRYIQSGRALLVMQQIPAHLNELGIQFDGRLSSIIRHLTFTVPLQITSRRQQFQFQP